MDEVCAYATHLELRGKNSFNDNFVMKPSKPEDKPKGKGKGKMTATI